jgi:organic radical activating enzyme
LQGEGASIGRPCVFLRLSRCNLACQWCDTAYTWHFEGDNRPHKDGIAFSRDQNQVTWSEEETAARIKELGGHLPYPRLVITGGEPLLQGLALVKLLAHLPGWRIEVETNGSVAPTAALDPLIAQYNVSPKLAHSGNPADLALPPRGCTHGRRTRAPSSNSWSPRPMMSIRSAPWPPSTPSRRNACS